MLATRGPLQRYNLMREIVPSIKSDRHMVNPNAESVTTVSLSLLIETCQAQGSISGFQTKGRILQVTYR